MKAKEFDAKFEKGKDLTHALDLSKAQHPGRQVKRVNVDFPEWMIGSLDTEAKRLGVTRQSMKQGAVSVAPDASAASGQSACAVVE